MHQAIKATKLIFLVFGIGISSWAPMVPLTKARLDLNDAELGLALLIFGIGAIITMPLSGWLVSQMGSRLLTLIAGVFTLTVIPFLTIVPTFFLLGLTLFFFGATTSALNIAINTQAVTVESQAKYALMSGFHCLFSLGGLLGVVLVGFLLEYQFDLFYCGLLVSSTMCFIILSQYKKLLSDVSKSNVDDNTSFVFPEKGVILLGILCFIAFMAEGSMLDWSAEFLRSSLNYSPSHAGIGYAIFSVAMALGRFMGDKLITRLGRNQVFQMGGLLAASGFMLLITSPIVYIELIGFFLIGLGASNIVPILFSSSGNFSTPSHRALTVITSFGYSGLLIGPGVVGLVANTFSLSLALSAIAVLLVFLGSFGSKSLKPSSSQAFIVN